MKKGAFRFLVQSNAQSQHEILTQKVIILKSLPYN
jgi:hypothetical protein